MLRGINVLLGVSGSIACYKACEIISKLKKEGAGVDVVMTKNAANFVTPLTFESLTNRPVAVDMFAPKVTFDVHHISLAKAASVCVIAPASANIIAKLAMGLADDMLSTTLLATKAPIIICPAMNTAMYENAATASNIAMLKSRGYIFVEPGCGMLACGIEGRGKLAKVDDIVAQVLKTVDECHIFEDIDLLKNIDCKNAAVCVEKNKQEKNVVKDYIGKKILITAGGTEEPIDGVRYISNRSSGKMGFALAVDAASRGAEVVLVVAKVTEELPLHMAKIVKVKTTQDMYDAVIANYKDCDIIIKAAAPADYRVEKVADNKIKGDNITLHLVKNVDIAAAVGKLKEGRRLVVFCAETQNLLESAAQKLKAKNADMIVANDVTKEGAGFETDTNIATIITAGGKKIEGKLIKKSELARQILDEILVL